MFLQQMEDLKEERQALFGFTQDEQESWMQAASHGHKHSSSWMEQIHQARRQQKEEEEDSSEPNAPSGGPTTVVEPNHNDKQQEQSVVSQPFTHLQSPNTTNTSTNQEEESWSIHMVNVGSKPCTERLAVAESRLVFPEHAWEALTTTTTTTTMTTTPTDLVGPKGPIFTTAKVAGILAAKYVCVVRCFCVLCVWVVHRVSYNGGSLSHTNNGLSLSLALSLSLCFSCFLRYHDTDDDIYYIYIEKPVT